MENHALPSQIHFQEQQLPDDMLLEKETHLWEYIEVLTKRKFLIALCMVLSASVMMFLALRTPDVYQARAQMIIDKEKSRGTLPGGGMEGYTSEALTFQTHFALMKSTQVMEGVVNALDLDLVDPNTLEISFFSKLKRQLKENVKLLLNQPVEGDDALEENLAETVEVESFSQPSESLDPETKITDSERKMRGRVGMIRSKIHISEVQNTRLINISVSDQDPAMAADIANTLAKEYIRFNLSNRVESSRENLEWLKQEMYHLRIKLEDDERALFSYKQKAKLFSLEGKQGQMSQTIGTFYTEFLQTRNERMELDVKISELERHLNSPQGLAKVRFLLNSSFIEELYSRINTLEFEYAKMSRVYKSKHPKVVEVVKELSSSRKRLDEELLKELTNFRSRRTVLKAREAALEKTVGEFEQDALDSSTKELQYTILQRNVTTSQSLYDVMLSRIKASDVLKTSDTSNIRIVERATAAASPISPNKKRKFFMGIIMGLVGGGALAFFLEYLDQSLRSEEDVQSYLNLPVLSVIPEADKSSGYGYTYGAK